jgi:hypothetical protein
MRTILVLIVLIFSVSLKAQTFLPGSFIDYTQRQSFMRNNSFNDSTSNKKWFLNTYSSISTGFNFFRGGNATVVTAPAGLQLNRRLNNNLYAFAGVSVAPAYVNFSRSFLTSNSEKTYQNNSFLKSGSFGMYAKAALGLMYVNDARTFSISGSIGVERNSYPVFPYNEMNNTRPAAVIAPH